MRSFGIRHRTALCTLHQFLYSSDFVFSFDCVVIPIEEIDRNVMLFSDPDNILDPAIFVAVPSFPLTSVSMPYDPMHELVTLY